MQVPQHAHRSELEACHAFLHPGDTLAVPALDRYGRSPKDLITIMGLDPVP